MNQSKDVRNIQKKFKINNKKNKSKHFFSIYAKYFIALCFIYGLIHIRTRKRLAFLI